MFNQKQLSERRCMLCDAGVPTIRRFRIPHILDSDTGYSVAFGSELHTMMLTTLGGLAENFAIRSDTLDSRELAFFRGEKAFVVTFQKHTGRSHGKQEKNNQPPTITWRQ